MSPRKIEHFDFPSNFSRPPVDNNNREQAKGEFPKMKTGVVAKIEWLVSSDPSKVGEQREGDLFFSFAADVMEKVGAAPNAPVDEMVRGSDPRRDLEVLEKPARTVERAPSFEFLGISRFKRA